MFCKSWELICEPEIVLKNFAAEFQANANDISCKNTFTLSVQFTNFTIRGNKHCRALEILKKNMDLSHIYLAVHAMYCRTGPTYGTYNF